MTRESSAVWLCGLAAGAALMYLLDPQQGRRRRALMGDKARRLARQAGDASGTLSRDVRNRVSGLKSRMWNRDASPAPDDVLRERVRSEIGRYASHARALDVEVQNACVCLRGPILQSEAEGVLNAARRVRGVHVVEDLLERHALADIPALQGGSTRPSWMERRWSPTTRALAGAGAVAGVTLAMLAAARARRGTVQGFDLETWDNWDPAGFA